MAIRYGRGTFNPLERYIDYMNMIADSPQYTGLSHIREENGKINWQCSSGKTTSFYKYFQERFDWWVNKADELGLAGSGKSDDRLTIAARIIHPTKKKVCLVCGQELYVGYMYMNANYAKKWNKLVGETIFEKSMPIYDAIPLMIEHIGFDSVRKHILVDFPEKEPDITLFDAGDYEKFFSISQHLRTNKLSPGYMGDCPHRLDGIHDYCTLCRKGNDPGRSDENMRTYNHDRRAFMWWAEGDWKVADTLYNSATSGKCANCGKVVKKISPDHIGPLACGFKQNGFFEPLCGKCNSAKNRRFTLDNVITLLDYEDRMQESVASWQVQTLWDSAKEYMNNDDSVKTLSNYMRAMQDYYLRILTYVAELGYYDFLTSFLHPEYANYTVEFQGLNPSTLSFTTYVKTPCETSGSRSLAARTVRIAFEELFEYSAKTVTQRKSLILKTVDNFLKEDYAHIDSIFMEVSKSATDLALQDAVTNDTMSLEEKDAKIQIIIESENFKHREERFSERISMLKSFVSKRGTDLSKLCLNEIKEN